MLALVGCGAENPSAAQPATNAAENQVREIVRTYFRDAHAGDARGMCASFTDELARYVARLQQTSCHKALRAELRYLPDSLSGYEIQAARIDGDTAVVSLDGAGGKDVITLRRAGAGWEIETAPGLGV